MSKELIDKALEQLQSARRRLSHEQQRVGRSNARRAVLQALRKVRLAMDNHYPNIPLAAPKRKMRRKWTPPQGWVQLTGKFLVSQYGHEGQRLRETILAAAEAGVPCKKGNDELWLPGWVMEIGPNVTRLKEAKRDRRMRAALQAAWNLKGLKGT